MWTAEQLIGNDDSVQQYNIQKFHQMWSCTFVAFLCAMKCAIIMLVQSSLFKII